MIMTTQEIFDKAVGGIIDQGQLGHPPRDHRCYYTVPGTNLHCAVGMLIKEEFFDARWNGAGFGYNPWVQEAVQKSIGRDYTSEDLNLLIALQNKHDAACRDGHGGFNEFLSGAKQLAKDFYLEWRFD